MVARQRRSLLIGEHPAQVLGACDAGTLCVGVKRCDDVVGYIANEDISHAVNDITPSGGRRVTQTIGSEQPRNRRPNEPRPQYFSLTPPLPSSFEPDADHGTRCDIDSNEWAQRDSNPRPLPCKGSALPTELCARERSTQPTAPPPPSEPTSAESIASTTTVRRNGTAHS